MRDPQWNFFSQITMGEASSFLAWLDRQPSGKAPLNIIDNDCPVQGDKLHAMLKVLSCLGFVFDRIDYLKIRHDGSDFVHANFVAKMAILRERINHLQPAPEVMNQLKNSTHGRLSKNVVVRYFNKSSASDLQGFLDWARMCELFHYDKRTDEIFYIHRRFPQSASEGSQFLKTI